MHLLTIDHIIVYAFLIITLAVGIYYGRGVKTLRNFAVADRSYGSTIITITLIATLIGAGTVIGSLIEAIESNFLYAFSLFGMILGIILFSIYCTPKFDKRFIDCISIGDVLGKFLGKIEGKIACFVMFLNSIGILGGQLIVMGHLCKKFLGLSYEASVILTSIIMILYSTFGGIRAVTMTDILQFFILIIAVPIISSVLLVKSQINTHDVTMHFQSLSFDKIEIIDYTALAVFWIIPFHFLQAPIVQRYLMVRDTKVNLGNIMLCYGFMRAIMLVILFITTICFLKLKPYSDPSEIISIILQEYIPIGVRGLVLAGLIAVIMSTADSFLNASSVLFVNNILPASFIDNQRQALSLTKITTLVSGFIALFMALQGFRAPILTVYADTLLIAGSSIPLMAGLFGFKVNRESFWICLITAIVTYSTSKYFLTEFEYIHSLFTLIASLAAFFISHYAINGGFSFDSNIKMVKHPERKESAI